jgi:hypothetical protein
MTVIAYRPLSSEFPTFNAAKIAEIDVVVDYNYIKKWDEYGTFKLTIPINIVEAIEITKNTILHVDNEDSLIVRNVTINDSVFEFEGRDLKDLLTRRITLFPLEEFEEGTFGGDPVEGSTEHCVKYYVERNITAATETNRRIHGFFIAPNQNRGIKDDRNLVTLQHLDEVVAKMCRPAEIGWDVRIDLANNRYVFDVYNYIDKSEEQTENSTVIFAAKFLNTESISRVYGNIEERNSLYAVNGSENETFVQLVNRNPYEPASGIDRLETSVSVNCDYEHIDAFALKAAEHMITNDSFEVPAGNIKDYGRLYMLGDKVSFRDAFTELHAVITEVEKDYSGEHKRIKITTGDKRPKAINSLQNAASAAQDAATSTSLINRSLSVVNSWTSDVSFNSSSTTMQELAGVSFSIALRGTTPLFTFSSSVTITTPGRLEILLVRDHFTVYSRELTFLAAGSFDANISNFPLENAATGSHKISVFVRSLGAAGRFEGRQGWANIFAASIRSGFGWDGTITAQEEVPLFMLKESTEKFFVLPITDTLKSVNTQAPPQIQFSEAVPLYQLKESTEKFYLRPIIDRVPASEGMGLGYIIDNFTVQGIWTFITSTTGNPPSVSEITVRANFGGVMTPIPVTNVEWGRDAQGVQIMGSLRVTLASSIAAHQGIGYIDYSGTSLINNFTGQPAELVASFAR